MFGLSTNYIVEFDIAAIVLTIMLLSMLLIRRTYPTVAIRQYTYILICNLISSVADLISAYTIYDPSLVSIPVNYGISVTFLLFHNLTSVFFMMYVISNIRKNLGTKGERILWISLIAFLTLCIITTPFTKGVILFDEAKVYSHGKFVFVLYVAPVISIVYSIFLLIKYRKSMSFFQIGTNISFIFFVIFSITFQSLVPNCLIENFAIANACLMMNIALDNPAIYFYKNTTCYNQSAFNASIELKIAHQTEFALVAFNFDDLSIIKKQLSENEYEEFVLRVIYRCQKIGGRKNLFILQDGTFAFIHDRSNLEKLIHVLEETLTKPCKFISGREISVNPHFSVLQFPGEAKTANDVTLVIQDTLSHVYRKTGERIIWDSTRLLKDLRREDEVVHFLRQSLRHDGITVLFQPMLNVKTGQYDRAEALVRLRENPIKSFPDEFIPIAEKNGLITDIGLAVLDQVCRFIQESGSVNFGLQRINVNLSMLQLLNRAEVEGLVDVCQRHGITPQQIVLEVTETATEGDGADAVYENIQYLKGLGFALSLDDYGSGYSNMDNLVKFSFDQIKVDKTLLWSAMKDQKSMVVLENVIKLVQNLGKECVVEGIEDEEMEALLKKLGVDYLQGYRYSKPITDLTFVKFLTENNK